MEEQADDCTLTAANTGGEAPAKARLPRNVDRKRSPSSSENATMCSF